MNIIYSTPSCYAKAVNDIVIAKNITLDLKTDDFLPYADTANKVWSGFFTSRASSKRYERLANNILQVYIEVFINNICLLKLITGSKAVIRICWSSLWSKFRIRRRSWCNATSRRSNWYRKTSS